jgi:hypothetical protein
MLRDYASGGGGVGGYHFNDASYSSNDWRRNQGYNLNRPTPPELGGTPYDYRGRDVETNPYYDPGWAQSVRRDSPSRESSYDDRRGYYNSYTGIESVVGGVRGRGTRGMTTYPGMSDPRRTDKLYTNPTNPYYDPVWSQSYVRNDEPIREGDHTLYYAPGYDVQNRNYYYPRGGMGDMGYGGGRGMMEGGMMGGGGGMMDGYYDDYRYGGGGMYATAATSGKGHAMKSSIVNGNSLMR